MSDPPVVDPEAFERTTAGTPDNPASVAGIVLAAGTSQRFGESNKLLAELGDEPIVRRATRTLVDAGVSPVVVVVGHEAERVREVLEDLPVSFVENPAYDDGQSTSVQAGLSALNDVDAAVIALGDMPCVDTESIERLVETYRADAGTALAAGYEGRRGNPVLFDSQHFAVLHTVDGDSGGRHILLDSPDAAIVETGDPGVRKDIDRWDDLPREE